MSHMLHCAACKCEMWLPDELYRAGKRSPDISFYCPYGHKQYFAAGETEADKLRRERDRLAQRVAERDYEVSRQRELREAADRRAAAARGQVTKLRKRVGAGVCPCCSRTFSQLAQHMTDKHPEFKAVAAA